MKIAVLVMMGLVSGCAAACPCVDLQHEIIEARHAYLQGMAERDALKEQVIACKMKQFKYNQLGEQK